MISSHHHTSPNTWTILKIELTYIVELCIDMYRRKVTQWGISGFGDDQLKPVLDVMSLGKQKAASLDAPVS